MISCIFLTECGVHPYCLDMPALYSAYPQYGESLWLGFSLIELLKTPCTVLLGGLGLSHVDFGRTVLRRAVSPGVIPRVQSLLPRVFTYKIHRIAMLSC